MLIPDPLKKQLRAEALAVRADAHRQAGGAAGAAIAARFLRDLPWRDARVVSGYVPMRDEADVMPLLERLAAAGIGLGLPVVTAKDMPLGFRGWSPGDPLETARFGTREPTADKPSVTPDILLVPLLAFDSLGTRLGYGGGYYDRTLAQLRQDRPVLAVGIAYAAQRRQTLPRGAHDQTLDWVVTEQDIVEITG